MRSWGSLALAGVVSLSVGCQQVGGDGAAARERGWCGPMAAGEARPAASFQTPIPAFYLISRPGADERYEITVRARFKDHDGSAPEAAAMRGKAQACLAVARRYFLGPRGERFSIRIADESETDWRLPPATEIGVSSIEPRGHQRLWRTSWSCHQIVHEVFHLVGLVDEYQEPPVVVDGSSRPRFDCRAPGPHHSLMAYPLLAYEAATAQATTITCRCTGADREACRQALDTASAQGEEISACPEGSEESAGERVRELLVPIEQALRLEALPSRPDEDTFRFVRRQAGERASLLLPAHVDAILFPACGERNARYYRCSAGAYRTSTDAQGCPSTPADECRGGAWLGAE